MKKRILSAILALLLVLTLLPVPALADDANPAEEAIQTEREILRVYELTPGSGDERELRHIFRYGELCDSAQTGSLGYMFRENGWRVCAAAEYVPLNAVLAAAGIVWSSEDSLSLCGSDGRETTVSCEELEKSRCFFPDGVTTDTFTEAPAVIALAWQSGGVGEYGDTPGAVLETLAGAAERNGELLFAYGIRAEEAANQSASVARLLEGLSEITVIHPCETHTLADKTVTAATCTEPGVSAAYCTVCGFESGDTFATGALGHDFTVWTADDETVHTAKCARCGAAGETALHTYKDGVCICGAAEPEKKSYCVAASAVPAEIAAGETTEIRLAVRHEDETVTAYNTYRFTLTYDAETLAFKSVSDAAAAAAANDGTLTIFGSGSDRAFTEPLAVTFEGKAAGKTAVTLTGAAVDAEAMPAQEIPAILETASAEITVLAVHTVTLPEGFTGDPTVKHGGNYTFEATDKNYDHKFGGSTMGGGDVTVEDNGNGTFTVKNVTGDLTIMAARTGKTYGVTVTGSGKDGVTAATEAFYGQDLTFTVDKEKEFAYTVNVTVGGEPCITDVKQDGAYAIPGNRITGNVVIDVTKTEQEITETTVDFIGDGKGDVAGGTSHTAKIREDFTFTIDKKSGYEYTVRLGETEIIPDAGGYTIPAANVTAEQHVVVTVEKTAAYRVEVDEYMKSNGRSIYLILASGAPVAGKTPFYDGNAMFRSEKYGAYAYLVFSEKEYAEVQTEAAAKITEITGSAAEIDYSGDVNKTGKTDVNDAQLVWNMYNARYADFMTAATLEMFLRADVNGDRTLNVNDAAAVVKAIG